MLPGPPHIRNLKDGFSSALHPPPFPPPSHPTSPDSQTCSVVPVLDRIPVMEQKENLSCLFLAENRKVLKINYCLCLLRHKTHLSGRLITAGCNSLRAPVFPLPPPPPPPTSPSPPLQKYDRSYTFTFKGHYSSVSSRSVYWLHTNFDFPRL